MAVTRWATISLTLLTANVTASFSRSIYLMTGRPSASCWPAPEVPENLNVEEMGRLGLRPEEERAIVVFLQTLNDGWSPPK